MHPTRNGHGHVGRTRGRCPRRTPQKCPEHPKRPNHRPIDSRSQTACPLLVAEGASRDKVALGAVAYFVSDSRILRSLDATCWVPTCQRAREAWVGTFLRVECCSVEWPADDAHHADRRFCIQPRHRCCRGSASNSCTLRFGARRLVVSCAANALPSRYAADAKSNIPVLAYARKPHVCTHVDLREAAFCSRNCTVIPRSTFSFRPSEWQQRHPRCSPEKRCGKIMAQ